MLPEIKYLTEKQLTAGFVRVIIIVSLRLLGQTNYRNNRN